MSSRALTFYPASALCLVFICVSSNLQLPSPQESSGYNQIPKEKLLLFQSFDSVMEVFHDPKYKDLTETKRLLSDFKNKCLGPGNQYNLPLKGRTRKPFIVIEGNQRTSRKIMARRIARRLGATYLSNPPPCLIKLTSMFPFGSVLRRSYFGLCMYATARHVNWLYNRWPVVLNGYYYDQASFSIARVYANMSLPLPGDHLYSWPEDLLKPDIIFYIDFPDNLHREPATTRHPSSWKPRMMKVYETLNDSSIVVINTKLGLNYVEDFLLEAIVDRLSASLDFNVLSREELALLKAKQQYGNVSSV